MYKNIRLYFYSWRCGAEKQSQKVHAHEGVVGRRKSQWTTDFSQNSGTYIVYNSHLTCNNSSFSLVMLFIPHWLLGQVNFCGRTHLPPSPNSTTSIGLGDIPIIPLLILSSVGCSCLNIHRYTAPGSWWHSDDHSDFIYVSVNNIHCIHTCRSITNI